MTAYADRGITASQLDFERPFVYLELFAGQATLSVAAYPCSIGFKYVVACRGCQDPEDIEDSTKDPDVVWITRKIEQLDTSSLLGHPHGLLRKVQGDDPTPHRRSHVPDVYSALSREYEGVTGATCHTIKPWRRQASEFYNTLRRCFLRRAARYLCNAHEVIYGLASHAAMETVPWTKRRVTKRSLETMAVLRGSRRHPTPIRCDNVLYPAVKAKNRVRFRVHLQISSISGTRDQNASTTASLMAGNLHFFWPHAPTILKVRHRRLLCQSNSDVKGTCYT
jgi:hypothetical protein